MSQGRRDNVRGRPNLCDREILRAFRGSPPLPSRDFRRSAECFVEEGVRVKDAGGVEHSARCASPNKAYHTRKTWNARKMKTRSPVRVHAARKFETRYARRLSALPSSLNSE